MSSRKPLSFSRNPSSDRELSSAVRSTYAAFIGTGFAFASWASRIPQIKNHLGLSPSRLGLVLLAIAAGSVLALPLTGHVVDRIGARRTVTIGAIVLGLALVAVAIGQRSGVIPLVVGLFVFGAAMGSWDVAMNVHGAEVERRLGRAIMPRFHAGFSVGTLAGALLGSGAIAASIPVAVHLSAVGVLVGIAVPVGVRGFVDVAPAPHERESAWARWRERRTVLIGFTVLAFAFTEGAGNDWIAVSARDGYHAADDVSTLAYATFLAAMTLSRWFGPKVLDRHGRVLTVRVLAGIALAGLVLFVSNLALPVAFLGALLWGIGASLGFPVGMSAAADEPAAAAGRVSVVASIGYCAFLGGPPLIGFLGSHGGVLHALLAVAVLLAASLFLAGALRPASTSARP